MDVRDDSYNQETIKANKGGDKLFHVRKIDKSSWFLVRPSQTGWRTVAWSVGKAEEPRGATRNG